MKKYKISIIFLIMMMLPIISFAEEELIQPEYTEEYKQWLELSEEEKQECIEPQAFKEVEEPVLEESKDSIFTVDTNSAGDIVLPSYYKRSYYGQVKNQNPYDACWAFASATMFDTNYYLTNGLTKRTFANFHMDYMTSHQYNPNGFNREFNSGGNYSIALAYATNGMGIALESNMPSSISTTSLLNVPKSAKVNDYIKISSKNQLKNYIYKYGVAPVYTHIDNNFTYFSSKSVYGNTNLAYCCTDSSANVNHAVTLVGWNDSYTNSSFPGKQGAYIALNSYGSEFGNNGIFYIFYDDVIISSRITFGATKTNDINYDYLYQHDPYGWTAECGFQTGTYGANVFTRQNQDYEEKLTQVSSYFPQTGNVTIYINSNGSNVSTQSATYTMQTNITEVGYHTIQLNSPVSLTNDTFTVGIKYPGTMPAEIPTTSGWCSTATSNYGESYISSDGISYTDTQKAYASYKYANACIKAYTTKGSSIKMFSINTSKNFAGAGNITSSQKVRNGTNFTVKATSNTGYKFLGWYNGNTCLSTNAVYTFTVTKDMNLVAKYEYMGDLYSYVFDYKYYADHNTDLFLVYGYNQTALRRHWETAGIYEGRASSSIFDAQYYANKNSDLVKSYGRNYYNLYKHFITQGYREYRPSSPEYDGTYYKNYNTDLKTFESMDLIRHYEMYGRSEGRRANVTFDIIQYTFDANVYRNLNADVAKVFGNNEEALRRHWYLNGKKEGRTASLIFDAKYYLNAYADLKKNYGNNYVAAYNHFVNDGFAEGRQGSDVFSVKYYIANNSDLKKGYKDNYIGALKHFMVTGKKEARPTSKKFNVVTYRQKNKDLNRVYGNNYEQYFLHYLICGKKEGRVSI